MSPQIITQKADRGHVPVEGWACNAAAYGRIISAVGEEPVNRDKLVFDLLSAREKLLRFRFLDSDKDAKARKELSGGIVRDAIALKRKLQANQAAARALFPEVSREHAFLGELDHIIDEAKVLKQQNSHGAWVRLERPLLEWFAAEILPDVFKRNFPEVHKHHPGEPVGFSRPAGGPYIRFAVAVMGEMGMHIEPNTVARAIQDVRDGRARRKVRPPITQSQSE